MTVTSDMTIRNVFFIDSRITGYENLILGLPEGSAWYLLDGGSDGVEQMATVLSIYSGLSSIQILSHGTEGTLLLGNAILDASSLDQYATLLSAIGSSLSDTGDLLLYGCNVAAGETGTQFIESLALITGADVAASSDITGTNGNWVLEQSTGGQIEAVQIDTAVVQQSFQGNLAALYTRTNPASFSEDGSTSFDFVLNVAPAFDVQLMVTLAEGLSWSDGTTDRKLFTFTTSDWFNYQTISFKAIDDLNIEGDLLHAVSISLQSADPTFNGVTEGFDVTVVDNDFQLTLEPAKNPSAGNNYIIYDVKDVTSANTYDLGTGTDKLEVSDSLGTSVYDVRFLGNTGNDSMSGVGVADGGTGNDVIVGSANGGLFSYTVYQTVYDTSYGVTKTISRTFTTPAFEQLAGGTGNDVVNASLSAVQANLAGGDGNDTITGSAQGDVIYGDSYNAINTSPVSLTRIPQLTVSSKTLYDAKTTISDTDITTYYTNYYTFGSSDWWTSATAGIGADLIDGGAGNDTIWAGGGDDTVLGGLGDDSIDAGAGADLVAGGDGNDTIYGQAGNDTIRGDAGNDRIDAGDGDDSIDAGEGNNTVYGGKGYDRIVLGVLGANLAYGGDDNDTIIGAAGADALYGDAGNDSISGAAGNDRLYGDIGLDTLIGGEGDDQLYGGGDNDSLLGQEGHDTLDGGDGDDTLDGAEGNDSLTGGLGNDSLLAGIGTDTIYGGDGNDTLVGDAGTDVLYGEAGNDSLSGGDDADTLDGGAGNDTLLGGAGNDSLTGGLGDDSIVGGDGNDTLYGNDGADTLTGGLGSDWFKLDANALSEAAQSTPVFDVITDFQTGVGGDIIDLSAIHAANLAAGYGDPWAGAEFAYTQGYITFVQSGADTLVQYDRDGLYGSYSGKTVAVLLNTVAADVLPGINSRPALSNKLYLISSSTTLSEDETAASTRNIVLGQAPTSDVVLTISGGDQIAINGTSSVTLTFTAANWYIPQTVTVTAVDDLLIEGDVPAPISYSFASSDGAFNGLGETRDVTVIDNDFQLTLEPAKNPSAGNNYIIYDVTDVTSANTYDLGTGTDKLVVSDSLATSVKDVRFLGNTGNDSMSGVGVADGGTGNDVIVGSTDGGVFSYTVTQTVYDTSYQVTKTISGTFTTPVFEQLAGGTGNDVVNASLSTVQANLAGGDGNDTITGSAQADVIYGDSYNAINTSPVSTTRIPQLTVSSKSLYDAKTSISTTDLQTY